jgi:hypothetical protein
MQIPLTPMHPCWRTTHIHELRNWGRTDGCGQIGDALFTRLRPSDGDAAQFLVGFMSVLAGTFLAAQAIKDAVRRSGGPDGITDGVPLAGDHARFANLAEAFNGLGGVRRYVRDLGCLHVEESVAIYGLTVGPVDGIASESAEGGGTGPDPYCFTSGERSATGRR